MILEAFESYLRRTLQARELGKAAALVSHLCPNAWDPQLVSVSSKENAQCESHCCTSSRGKSNGNSDDLPDDHEISTEWHFEGHLYFATGHWPAGKTFKDAVRAAVEEQYQPTPVSVHSMVTILRPNPTGNC